MAGEPQYELSIHVDSDIFEAFRQYCFDVDMGKGQVARQAQRYYPGLPTAGLAHGKEESVNGSVKSSASAFTGLNGVGLALF
jgi:hypothetical protein